MSLLQRGPEESLLEQRRVQLLGVLVILALVIVPFTTTAHITEIVLIGLVFVMLGVSWNLIAGYAGQVSLGHAAFFGMGAFVAAWLTTPTAAGLPESIRLPVIVAVPIGALAAGLIALVIGPVIFRLTGHYFAIGTLALAAIIELVMADQREFTGGASGYYVNGNLDLPAIGASHEDVIFLLTVVATVITVLVTYWIVRGSGGLAMRAIHDDEDAASSLGVNPLKYKMYAFVVSAFFAGLAGALYGQFTLYINAGSTLAVGWTIDALVVVILGGMGTFAGPILGAALFLIIDDVLAGIVGNLATAAEGVLIIAFMIFLPKGLYGLVEDYLLTVSDESGSSVAPADDGFDES